MRWDFLGLCFSPSKSSRGVFTLFGFDLVGLLGFVVQTCDVFVTVEAGREEI